MRIPDKGPNTVQEGADQEKAVIRVKTIRGIPDGYDAAASNVQYVVDEQGHSGSREYGE